MRLSTIDRLVRKLEPVNALVEKLCERLLPHEVVHAAGTGQCECVYEPAICGSKYGYYATFCNYGPGTPYEFEVCGC